MIFTKHANVTARRPCGFIFFLILIKQLTFCKTSVIRIVFFVRNVYKRKETLKTHRIYRYCLQNVFGYFRMLCYSGVGGIRSADTRRMDRNQTYWPLPHASRIICMLIFLIELNIFMLKLFKICVQCGLYILSIRLNYCTYTKNISFQLKAWNLFKNLVRNKINSI